MSRSPRFSVLLPVFNGRRTVAAAALSVLRQSETDLELIVLDDGSDDGSADSVRALNDPRIRVLPLPHGGLTAALSAGLEEARGDFVARIDADDRCRADRLELQGHFLERHPHVALVGSGVDVVTPSGSVVATYRYPTAHEALRVELGRLLNPLPHSTHMYRRAVIKAVGGYRREFLKAQDYDLCLRVAERDQLASIPEPLVALAHGSVTMTSQDGQQFRFAVLAYVCALHRERVGEDPLDAPGAAGFLADFDAWYEGTRYPRAFRSRLARREARAHLADGRLSRAAAELLSSLKTDPAWPLARLGVLPGDLTREATTWLASRSAS